MFVNTIDVSLAYCKECSISKVS